MTEESKPVQDPEVAGAELPEENTALLRALSDISALSRRGLEKELQDGHMSFLIGAGSSRPLCGLLGPVEELLTAVDGWEGNDAKKSELARGTLYAHFFEKAIAPNLSLLAGEANALKVLDGYSEFLRSVHGMLVKRGSSTINKRANVFTTNVDIAIEMASEATRIELNDGFSGRFEPYFDSSRFGAVRWRKSLHYDFLSEVPTIDLYKIHGSSSWTKESKAVNENLGSDISLDLDLELVREVSVAHAVIRGSLETLTEETTAEELKALPEIDESQMDQLREFTKKYEGFLIVNPTKQKFGTTVMDRLYYDQLRTFSNELEKENARLYVIGFSCRDEHLRDLIQRAARANPTLLVRVFAYERSEMVSLAKLLDVGRAVNRNIQIIGPDQPAEGEERDGLDITTVSQTLFSPLSGREQDESEEEAETPVEDPAGVMEADPPESEK